MLMPEPITEKLDELVNLLDSNPAVEVDGEYVRKFDQYDSELIDEILAGYKQAKDALFAEAQIQSNSLYAEVHEALEKIFLNEILPLDILLAYPTSRQVLIRAGRRVTPRRLGKMTTYFTRLYIDPSPIARKLDEVLEPFKVRAREIYRRLGI